MANDVPNDLVDAGAETRPMSRKRRRKPTKRAQPKPAHYKVICISIYTRDLDALDAKVAELKRRGWTKGSKSELIRIALSRLDVDDVVAAQGR